MLADRPADPPNRAHEAAIIAALLPYGAVDDDDDGVLCLLAQAAQASAVEGAQPATSAGSGLTPEQLAALAEAPMDPWLAVLWPLGVAAGALASAAVQWWPALVAVL